MMRITQRLYSLLALTVAIVLNPVIVWAANASRVQASIDYVAPFGDTYDGVTTDDGDHLAGSLGVRAQVGYGRFVAIYAFESDKTASVVNGTTPSGTPGTTLNYPAEQTVVPVFTAVNAVSEFRLEYRPWRSPVYVGVAHSNSWNNYGFPRLQATGAGVEAQPSARRVLSPYGSYFFFPNQSGTYPLAAPTNPRSGAVASAFRVHELLAGLSWALAGSPVHVVFGYYQTICTRKTGTFNFSRDGPFIGVRFQL
jgi:hypothetical protein